LRSNRHERAACAVLRTAGISGITANADRMRTFVEHSIGIVTALVPVLGYEASTDIARTALESGRGVFDIVLERGLLTRAQLDEILNPAAMTAPRSVS
jgi:aspartate ammonia-lyase